jgi:hypothetical protein
MSSGRRDWSDAFPSLGAWAAVLAIATVVGGTLYGPIYLLDLWDTRQWARENPGANILMWVIFSIVWLAIAAAFVVSFGDVDEAPSQAAPSPREVATDGESLDGPPLGSKLLADAPPVTQPVRAAAFSPSDDELQGFLAKAKREADYEHGKIDRVALSAFRRHSDGRITANCRVYPFAEDDHHWTRVFRA